MYDPIADNWSRLPERLKEAERERFHLAFEGFLTDAESATIRERIADAALRDECSKVTAEQEEPK